jgi:nucleotide-binding universal stress UspA family protein
MIGRLRAKGRSGLRTFLIVLDETPEMLNAMRYAAIRASKTGGGVEILAIISPEDFQHFMGVADVMRAEAREKIEAHFQVFKDRMEQREGVTPKLSIREGDKVDCVLEHIRANPHIGVLVLGAGVDNKQGAGPIVTALTGRRLSELTIPLTIVPGSMTKEEIVAVT